MKNLDIEILVPDGLRAVSGGRRRVLRAEAGVAWPLRGVFGAQSEPFEERRRRALLLAGQPGRGAPDFLGVVREDRRQETAAAGGNRGVADALVLRAATTGEEAAPGELVDDVRHAPAGEQHAVAQFTDRKVALVVQGFEDREFASRQSVPFHIAPRALGHRAECPCEDHPELERDLAIGDSGGRRHLDVKIMAWTGCGELRGAVQTCCARDGSAIQWCWATDGSAVLEPRPLRSTTGPGWQRP